MGHVKIKRFVASYTDEDGVTKLRALVVPNVRKPRETKAFGSRHRADVVMLHRAEAKRQRRRERNLG